MPYDDPDPQDPMLLVGVSLPADPESARDMAYTVAEEFARLGYSGRQIVSLFKEPFYAGAHGVYTKLGEPEILRIVEETMALWGRMRLSDRESAPVLNDPSVCGGCVDE